MKEDWEKWWGPRRERYRPPVEGGRPPLDRSVVLFPGVEKSTYFGMKVLSTRLCFIGDTSGSMGEESGFVQANLNQFSQQITASGIDVHVVLLAMSKLFPFPGLPGICIAFGPRGLSSRSQGQWSAAPKPQALVLRLRPGHVPDRGGTLPARTSPSNRR